MRVALKKTGFTEWGTSPCRIRLTNAVSARNRNLLPCLVEAFLSGQADAVCEYHRDLPLILGGMIEWQKRLPPPLSPEEEQTPEVVMGIMILGADLDVFPEEH